MSAPETIRVLNEMLIAEHRRHRTPVTFATMCLVSIDTELATASVLLAGHPPPILVASGAVRECDVPPCPAIGIMGFAEWHSHEVSLPDAPWTLVLYTDGLVEGRSAPDGRRPLGPGRLLEMLAARTPPITDADADTILAQIEQANGGPLPDDVVFLAASPQTTADAAAVPQSRLGLVRG